MYLWVKRISPWPLWSTAQQKAGSLGIGMVAESLYLISKKDCAWPVHVKPHNQVLVANFLQ